jgi:hypothetical protein
MRPVERRGTPSSGRIVTLVLGQGHGFIRLASIRKVFSIEATSARGRRSPIWPSATM